MTQAEQPELIPLRALNQVSYCPRLYYLEYVESVMPINEYVEDGLFQHRRVNDPALADRARREGDVVCTRSVSLSSERLGITGKLDLLEESDDIACPVETKRSAAPKDEAGQPSFYENDAIQHCAQGLLVEENQGVTIPAGIIYHVGSKARVHVPFDATLRSRTLAAIALVRDLAAREVPPEPLPPELRHRCFGCSLAPVCLPEETLYLIQQPQEPPVAPAEPLGAIAAPSVTLTRVIPHNDDKAVLYLRENGSHVSKRGEHLVVSQNGREFQWVPIVSVRQVVVFGNVQVSTQALQTLVQAEVPLVYLNMYGKLRMRY
jgi:CRISP-associated protein Cas1